MQVRDYNGKGKWAWEAIRSRYLDYAARLGLDSPLDLRPKEVIRGETRWIYPLMEEVIQGIKGGDAACAAIGIEFMEEDGKFVFGASLKSRTARALRQATLSETQAVRIRRRVTSMLVAGNVPREFRDYVRLLRKVGFEDFWPRIESEVPRDNKYVMRYFAYLRAIHERFHP
ncbi:MAG TPA: hypothetical protein VGF58_10455 [Burkholderiales bacterium]|jgi:hypothetical protein